MTRQQIEEGIFHTIQTVGCERCREFGNIACAKNHKEGCDAKYMSEASAIYEWLTLNGLLVTGHVCGEVDGEINYTAANWW